jgi:hypothetical protein
MSIIASTRQGLSWASSPAGAPSCKWRLNGDDVRVRFNFELCARNTLTGGLRGCVAREQLDDGWRLLLNEAACR